MYGILILLLGYLMHIKFFFPHCDSRAEGVPGKGWEGESWIWFTHSSQRHLRQERKENHFLNYIIIKLGL
jgi:hypothetical protein